MDYDLNVEYKNTFMNATIVDLRYKMNDVLKALDRNEEVTILFRGKQKGKIVPDLQRTASSKVEDHPFFGSQKKQGQSVEEIMRHLRGERYRAL